MFSRKGRSRRIPFAGFYPISIGIIALLVIANLNTLAQMKSLDSAVRSWLSPSPNPTEGLVFTPVVVPTNSPTPKPIPLPRVPLPLPSADPRLAPCSGRTFTVTDINEMGAAGNHAMDLELHNAGPAACTMEGYAKIRVVRGKTSIYDAHVRGEETWVASEPSFLALPVQETGLYILNPESRNLPLVRLVTIDPGGDAFIGVEWQEGGEVCSDARLIVAPPRSLAAAEATSALGIYTCDGYVSETPVAPLPILLPKSDNDGNRSYSGRLSRIAANYIEVRATSASEPIGFYSYPYDVECGPYDQATGDWLDASKLRRGMFVNISYDTTVPGIRHVDECTVVTKKPR